MPSRPRSSCHSACRTSSLLIRPNSRSSSFDRSSSTAGRHEPDLDDQVAPAAASAPTGRRVRAGAAAAPTAVPGGTRSRTGPSTVGISIRAPSAASCTRHRHHEVQVVAFAPEQRVRLDLHATATGRRAGRPAGPRGPCRARAPARRPRRRRARARAGSRRTLLDALAAARAAGGLGRAARFPGTPRRAGEHHVPPRGADLPDPWHGGQATPGRRIAPAPPHVRHAPAASPARSRSAPAHRFLERQRRAPRAGPRPAPERRRPDHPAVRQDVREQLAEGRRLGRRRDLHREVEALEPERHRRRRRLRRDARVVRTPPLGVAQRLERPRDLREARLRLGVTGVDAGVEPAGQPPVGAADLRVAPAAAVARPALRSRSIARRG